MAPNSRRRMQCHNGHEFNEENTLWRQGRRRCRACQNARNLKYMQERRRRAREGS
jgi:hypothetical protein